MIHLRKAKDGGFYLNIVAANGRELWRTSETYKRRAGAINALSCLYLMLTDIATINGKYPFVDHTVGKSAPVQAGEPTQTEAC